MRTLMLFGVLTQLANAEWRPQRAPCDLFGNGNVVCCGVGAAQSPEVLQATSARAIFLTSVSSQ